MNVISPKELSDASAVTAMILAAEKIEDDSPVNAGRDDRITMNQAAGPIFEILGWKTKASQHDTTKPQGVASRAADLTTTFLLSDLSSLGVFPVRFRTRQDITMCIAAELLSEIPKPTPEMRQYRWYRKDGIERTYPTSDKRKKTLQHRRSSQAATSMLCADNFIR